MSFLDLYKRNIMRRREEIARLQQDKAKEQVKIAELSSNISSAEQGAARHSAFAISDAIERYQKDKNEAEEIVATLDKKIAHKQNEIAIEQKKIQLEKERLQEIRVRESKQQELERTLRMDKIDSTLVKHEEMHKKTLTSLEKLQALPERIVVLFLAANPANQQQLRLDEEARSINEMIRKARHRDSVEFETRWAVQPMDVLQAINELSPTVIHFSGHGSSTDQIVFQDENGNAKLVSKEALVQTMMASSGDIRLVFFNTCYSYNQAESVTRHVEAAIGMNTSIGDQAARVFSSQFYSALGFGLSIKRAFEQAKAMVMLEGLEEENTPELFVQAGLDADDIIIVRPNSIET